MPDTTTAPTSLRDAMAKGQAVEIDLQSVTKEYAGSSVPAVENFSLTIPARASSPDRIRSLASVSCSPWSYGLAASAADARSMSSS